tara:strand:+ start:260 stop:811 length:552 start_codon:yes stop_codon:yes gene_type:complete
MSFKSNDIAWIPPTKGDYCPPPQEIYKNLICRKIKTSNYIDRHISHFIGKDGRQFIEWTNQFDVLYIFYKDRQIEVWGEDPTNVHSAIHFIIEKIKKMNQKRQERYEQHNTQKEQDVSLPISSEQDSSEHVSLTIASEQESSEQESMPDSSQHVSLTIASEQESMPDSSEHKALPTSSEEEGY